MAASTTASDALARMPKAELHLHLEGTIAPATLWAMAQRNRVALPAGTPAELEALYAFTSFDAFLALWIAMCGCFRTEDDYAQMVDGFAEACGRQNIRYVEAHFTPFNHEQHGFGGRRALEIVTRRLLALEAAGGVVTRLIVDIPGESTEQAGSWTAALLEEEANPLVVALGLGGPEQGLARARFAPYFERARRAGYACVAHAGETGGPDQVRQAVLELGVRRVQHGVRAAEDDATLGLLAERDVCCDVALTSNTLLTPYRDLSSHPLPRMIAAGVPVTLNTDDPPFFGTDLTREYGRAHRELGLSLSELWEIDLNGLRYALAEAGLKRRLMREFQAAGEALGLAPGPPAR